jgi:hypothetical protein
MFKKVLLSAAIFSCMGLTALQGARAEDAPAAPKVTEVLVCPFMETPSEVDQSKAVTIENYKVYLCCKGCMRKWAKLSKEEQLKKAEAALKIQQANAKKAG